MSRYKEIDLKGLKTYSATTRNSKVTTGNEASSICKGMTIAEFLDSLPSSLKADDFLAIAKHFADAS